MNLFKPFMMAAWAAAFLVVSGCSTTTTIDSDMGIEGAPDWVNEGTQAVDDDDGRYLQGVASAPPLGDESLQASTADSRARAELARIVSTFVDGTLSDYAASTGSDSSHMSVEKNVTSTTQAVLNGAKIKGRWKDKTTGNIYSFAEMDMKALDDAIQAASKLSGDFKEYYSNTASANFERFMEENQ